jgi:hypothetical protein
VLVEAGQPEHVVDQAAHPLGLQADPARRLVDVRPLAQRAWLAIASTGRSPCRMTRKTPRKMNAAEPVAMMSWSRPGRCDLGDVPRDHGPGTSAESGRLSNTRQLALRSRPRAADYARHNLRKGLR